MTSINVFFIYFLYNLIGFLKIKLISANDKIVKHINLFYLFYTVLVISVDFNF